MFVAFIAVVHTPFIVKRIIERARKQTPTHRMALQWFDPITELRIMVGIHGPQHVPSTINFMEMFRREDDLETVYYATDLIEVTNKVAPFLMQISC